MLDIKFIIENKEKIQEGLDKKGYSKVINLDELLSLHSSINKLKTSSQAKAEENRPTLIIGHTVMGKGVRTADDQNFEGQCSTHGQPLSKSGASFEQTIIHLGGDPNDPFRLFDETVALYEKRKEELKAIMAKRYAAKAKWEKENPELSNKLKQFFAAFQLHHRLH